MEYLFQYSDIFTVRNSSCGRVMFHKCVSRILSWGGMHGKGECMVEGGICSRGMCMAGGVWQGVCMARRVYGREGCAWQGRVCMAGRVVHGTGHVWQGCMQGRRDGHCSLWYASYWNAFLLSLCH